MTHLMTRRDAVLAATAAAAAFSGRAGAATSNASGFAEIEQALGGRLGVAALDTTNGRRAGHRDDERFPMCSTFKALAAGLVLSRVDHGEERLDRRVVFGREILVPNSPETQNHVGADGMSMAEICRAAVTRSDNTAGNLMLASFGGPAALTAFVRTLGDETTRLDRTETSLNEALPGDPRDTTTPMGMVGDLHRLLLDEALSASSRRQLGEWLAANTTGDARIRASTPAGWRVGDKTGTGERGAAGDVAILWPPDREPILMAIYTAGSTGGIEDLNHAIAQAARIVLEQLGV